MKWGSATQHRRYMQAAPKRSRRHCFCGCKRRATHLGMANGVCLLMGCELRVRRWVRDGAKASRVAHNAALRGGEAVPLKSTVVQQEVEK